MSDEVVVVPKKLLALAVTVAMDAPLKRSQGYAARIPWDVIMALRAELDDLGIDWRVGNRIVHGTPPPKQEVNQ